MAEGGKKEKHLHQLAQTHQQVPAVTQNGNAQGGDISAALLAIMEMLECLEQGGAACDKKASPKKGSFNFYRCGQGGHIARGCKNEPTPEWTQRQLNRKLGKHSARGQAVEC
ncbi:hypothetical protein HOLleu_16613 [Holothuria leucospilota]|uniref:CCHC-type domain-containing protein n=1 Tax=Holothuria leucospilota TaxID=206669 RepID=A0A9Q1HB40_HOLLE|nr:hypothetical protein HOLleu_16613 [Holothuria leucospilota]